MANPLHLEMLRNGVPRWNAWREQHSTLRPDLSGTDLGFLRYSEQFSPRDSPNLSNCDLRGVALSDLKLTHWNFRDSDLRGANFNASYYAVAYFSGADLRGVDLRKQDLFKIVLFQADLRGADLSGGRLHNAIISEADLRGTNLAAADLSVFRAKGAKFHGATLTDFAFADEGYSEAFYDLSRSATILALAEADGLDDVTPASQPFVQQYLERAFRWANELRYSRVPHDEPTKWLKDYYGPEWLDTSMDQIRAIQNIYSASEHSSDISRVLSLATDALIAHLKRHPNRLYDIGSRQFEALVAEILRAAGWYVELTQATRDGGYDIFAISSDRATGTTASWIVECKRYSDDHPIGLALVRNLYGLRCELQHGAAMLVTTSRYTKDARAYASERYNLHLKDYHNLICWINDYHPHKDGKLLIRNDRLRSEA